MAQRGRRRPQSPKKKATQSSNKIQDNIFYFDMKNGFETKLRARATASRRNSRDKNQPRKRRTGRHHQSQPRHPHHREAPDEERTSLLHTLFNLPGEASQLTDALRRMTKPPLKDRIVFIHGVEQLVEIDEYPSITGIQRPLLDAKHPSHHPPILTIPPLSLETNFLLFRKHHTDNAGTCVSYK